MFKHNLTLRRKQRPERRPSPSYEELVSALMDVVQRHRRSQSESEAQRQRKAYKARQYRAKMKRHNRRVGR